MSHKHFCEMAGHEWVCESSACVCICGEAMEARDHRECPIELRACAEHPYGGPHANPDDSADQVRLQVPDNIEQMMENWATYAGEKIGWCLLCDSPIRSEHDLIPGTNTHNCEAGRSTERASGK